VVELGDSELPHKLNQLYLMRTKDTKGRSISVNDMGLVIPVRRLTASGKDKVKVDISAELIETKEVQAAKAAAEKKPGPESPDFRLVEIMRNINRAFTVLMVMMCLTMYISVTYYLHVWHYSSLNSTGFLRIEFLSIFT
jgi:hypothetical protein